MFTEMSPVVINSGSDSGNLSLIADMDNLLGSITTKGGSFTATQDCIMIGTASGSYAAFVYIDGTTSDDYIIQPTAGSGQSRSAIVGNENKGIGMAIPKGSVITTRSDYGSYDLKFYGILNSTPPIVNITSGTTTAAARNTDITINTGIKNLKHFVWMAKITNSNVIQTVEYLDDVFQNKYNASCVGFSASTANTAFGTAATNVFILASNTDIANGIIVIHTFNSTYGDVDAGIWFAE